MAFVGLVGLYACNVRRLRAEKRKPANFLDCFAPMFSALAFASIVIACLVVLYCFAPVLCEFLLGCGLCCWWFSFPFGYMTKRKGGLLGSSSLCGLWVIVMRLLYV